MLSEQTMTFQELIVRVGGKMDFTLDELERQIDQCDGLGEDFYITVGDDRYHVPVKAIRDYFSSHKRPNKPMNKDQEIELLRRRVQDLENSLAADRVKNGPDEEEMVSPAPEVTLEDVIRDGNVMNDVVGQGEGILGPRETPEQIAARLKREIAASNITPITKKTPSSRDIGL